MQLGELGPRREVQGPLMHDLAHEAQEGMDVRRASGVWRIGPKSRAALSNSASTRRFQVSSGPRHTCMRIRQKCGIIVSPSRMMAYLKAYLESGFGTYVL